MLLRPLKILHDPNKTRLAGSGHQAHGLQRCGTQPVCSFECMLHELRTKFRLGGPIGDKLGFFGGPIKGYTKNYWPGLT